MVTKYKERQIGRKLENIAKWGRSFIKGTMWAIALFALISSIYMIWEIRSFVITHTFHWQSPIVISVNIRPVLDIKPLPRGLVPPYKDTTKNAGNSATVAGKATPAPKSEKDIVMSHKWGEVLWNIYGLETTWGRSEYCRNNGLGYGGFGVLDRGKIVCYDSFSKAVERAEYWLIQNGLGTKPLANVLCIWNEGIDTNTCQYYKTYTML